MKVVQAPVDRRPWIKTGLSFRPVQLVVSFRFDSVRLPSPVDRMTVPMEKVLLYQQMKSVDGSFRC